MSENDMEKIRKFLECCRNKQLVIRCIGDSMVDQYYDVSVDKISQEHPMFVMRSYDKNVIQRPGGVANVSYQMKNFNVRRQLVCFSDKILDDVMQWHSCSEEKSVAKVDLIPLKKRYIQKKTQVCRRDVEADNYGLTDSEIYELQSKLLEHNFDCEPDVVLFSDYGKGIFNNFDWTKFKNKITIVDPKNGPIEKWRGCTVFKPNKYEAEKLSGLKDWRSQCQYFRSTLGCRAVVITHGGEKVVGSWDEHFFEYVTSKTVLVQSVIGAGDCFVALLAMAVGHGFVAEEAVSIAYQAGSVYVQHNMNRPIVPAELSVDKIVAPEDLAVRDFKLAIANGCYDLLHAGHIDLLQYAKSSADRLCVLVNSDESVKKIKSSSRPIIPLQDRMKMLASIGCVDYVCSFDSETPLEVIKMLRPEILVKGDDWKGKEVAGSEFADKVLFFPLVDGISTTKIIEKIKV
jgi:D-beta-D-heptose 7-phosphate kinase/D-beta-D-heptose 1-phosphate adenosyltransferase